MAKIKLITWRRMIEMMGSDSTAKWIGILVGKLSQERGCDVQEVFEECRQQVKESFENDAYEVHDWD
jgi:hypothetical protein